MCKKPGCVFFSVCVVHLLLARMTSPSTQIHTFYTPTYATHTELLSTSQSTQRCCLEPAASGETGVVAFLLATKA